MSFILQSKILIRVRVSVANRRKRHMNKYNETSNRLRWNIRSWGRCSGESSGIYKWGKDRVEQIWNEGKSEDNNEKFRSLELDWERLEVEQVMTHMLFHTYSSSRSCSPTFVFKPVSFMIQTNLILLLTSISVILTLLCQLSWLLSLTVYLNSSSGSSPTSGPQNLCSETLGQLSIHWGSVTHKLKLH